MDGGGGGAGEPDGVGVGEERGNERIVCEEKGLYALPQVKPAGAVTMLRRREARETREDMWGEKVNMGSKVTPRMRGFSAKGREEELRVKGGWLLVWWVWEEKSETVDFWAQRLSPFRSAHCDQKWAVLGLFPEGIFSAGLFPAVFPPLGLSPAGLFPARYFLRRYFFCHF